VTHHKGLIGLTVALGIASAVAALSTSDVVYMPPSSVLLLAGVLIVAVSFIAGPRVRRLTTWIGAGVIGAVAGQILFTPGMPRVHDLMHFWGIWAYGRCVQEGALYPLWMPYLGTGIPLFQFYGPLNFLLALPGILFGLTPVGAWKFELFTGHVVSALSIFAAARLIGLRRRAALFAAVALACAPWRLCVFNYRGALGEANAFLFMPLVIGAALRMLVTPSILTGTVLVLSVSALILTHTLSLFTVLLTLLPVLIVWELIHNRPDRLRRIVRFGVPWLLAAGLTAAWWVPVLIETPQTSIKETTADNADYAYSDQGVSPLKLFERRLWDRQRVSIPASARQQNGYEGQQMPFYTGAGLMLLGLSAWSWSGSKKSGALALGALAGLLLSTSLLSNLETLLPVLSPLRFPWRFLSPATVFAALALGVALDRLMRRPALIASVVFVALTGMLAWDGAPYMGASDWVPPYTGTVHWYTDDPQWTHWDESMQAVPVILPEGSDPFRVRNLELPPSAYDTPIDSFYPGYYEWLTPTVYRQYWRSHNPAMLAEAGVRYGFVNSQRNPALWPARPYATLESDSKRLPLVVELIARKPGRVAVTASVPAEGATLLVLEQAFPGWRVRVDGDSWHSPQTLRGFLAHDLPAGQHDIEFVYGNHTPARMTGLLVSGITLLGLFVLAFTLRRRSANGQQITW
jgi:hypothetical protein